MVRPVERAQDAFLVGDEQRDADRRREPIEARVQAARGHGFPRTGLRLDSGGPQVQGGVGAPGPPGLGAGEQSAGVGRRPSPSASARIRPMSAAGRRRARAARAWRCTARSIRRCRAAAFSSAIASSRSRRGPKSCGSAAHGARPRRSAPRRGRGACRRAARSTVGQALGARERRRQALASAPRRPAAARRSCATSLPARPARPATVICWPRIGADRQLEAVPGAGHAQARPRRDQRRERRILREVRADRRGSAARSNTRRTRAMIAGSAFSSGSGPRRLQPVASPPARPRSRRACAVERDGAGGSGRPSTPSTPGMARAAGRRSSRPSRRAGCRAARPSRAPAAGVSPCRERRSVAGGRPNSCWKVSLKRRTLPKPEASATSAIGRRVSWISCLASSTRRVWATATGEAPEVLAEQAAQLALADAEALGQGFDVAVVQRAGLDQRQRAGDGVGGAAPGAEVGRGLRAAAQAGPKARLLGRRGGGVEARRSRASACAPGRSDGSRCRWSCTPTKSRPSNRASRVESAR